LTATFELEKLDKNSRLLFWESTQRWANNIFAAKKNLKKSKQFLLFIVYLR
jgi:hypothetical protein